jgi:small subunit ribosomal protein S1
MNDTPSDPSQTSPEPPQAAEQPSAPPVETPRAEAGTPPESPPGEQAAGEPQSPEPRAGEAAPKPPRGKRSRHREKPRVMEGLGAHLGSRRGRPEEAPQESRKADREGETLDREGGPSAEPRHQPAPAPTARREPRSPEAPRPAKPPRPRIERNSPELDREVEAALGGMSLEDVLEGKPAAGPAELEPESRVVGKVVAVGREDVFFDLGGPSQGVAPLRQFEENPEVGQEIELIVLRHNPEEGLYDCMRPGASIEVADWGDIEEGSVVDATVTGHNKGGLECKVGGIRGFMPVSQISLYRVEDLEEFVGQTLTSLVTEANADRGNLVLSRRAILEREQAAAREQLLQELAPGQTREGVVRSLQDFGAFVDLGGVDGLVHISQLSWERVKHPSDVLHVGQRIKVKVEKFDPETGKVGLSYRETFNNPWDDVDAKYPPHTTHTGTVSKIADFGAFVKLEPGIEGLIHISELAHQRVRRVSDVLTEGQEVEVQILATDKQAQRISLSLKALTPAPQPVDKEKEAEDKAIAEIEASNKPVKHKGQLKGGVSRPTGGEKFGLKW